jgi:acyl transferase domain-containing protein
VAPVEGGIPFCSSLVGDFLPGTALTSEYWYRSLAGQVRFDTAVRAFGAYAGPLFVEVSPHPILAGAVHDILDGAGLEGGAVGSLRRGAGGRRQFALSVAQAYVKGAAVAWPRLVGPVRRLVDLPTYAFDRRRYWIGGADAGPVAGASAHPLLVAAVPVAEGGGQLLTGRLSRSAVPWLADHTVAGAVLLPGTAFVELALEAAEVSGAGRVEELTLHAPLVLPAAGAVEVQVAVGGPDPEGRRSLSVHARPAGAADEPWTRHAAGVLAPADDGPQSDGPAPGTAEWPPAGAVPVELSDAYDRLADAAYAYGPAFQGLTGAWRAGDALFAEVRLPEPAGDAAAFTLHPALLDAALHVLVLDAAGGPDGGGPLLPFAWSGVRMAARGADVLRVRLTAAADGGWALALHDTTGRWIGAVDSLTLRQIPSSGLVPAADEAAYRIDWTPARPAAPDPTGRQWAVVGTDPRAKEISDALRAAGVHAPLHYEVGSVADLPAGTLPPVVLMPCLPDPDDAAEDPPYAARQCLYEVLDAVQRWVADERFADARLVFLADPLEPATAPVWGLVRSAQTEHPGRFVLADVDPGEAGAWGLLAAALDAGEPQFAVRGGEVLLPRVARRAAEGPAADLTGGTVLVTGGTGALAALAAARLVERHGVRDLLLVSRRGAAAPGADELAARLGAAGAAVRIAACDVSDRTAVRALLASVPQARPLVAVVHAAGALDDTTVERLSPERLDTVLAPKAEAAWLLHELTADLPLRAFVLFSSVTGVLGAAGQANYAAANAFLDALAAHRRGLGLPAVSVDWGRWATGAGMTASLSAADEARLSGIGAAPLPEALGLELFDAALLAGGDPQLVASRWDTAALRARAGAGGEVPAVLRELVRAPRRPAAPARARDTDGPAAPAAGGGADAFAARLADLDREQARAAVLDLVRARVAAALGHSSPGSVELDLSFSELGLDSLTSVELRNQLGSVTGLRLPATVVFDRPTVTELAGYLLDALAPAAPAPDQVLREALARVTERLDGHDAAPEDRARVTAVLEAALARLGSAGGADAPAAGLDAASDEEMFRFIDFIDNEL